MLAAVYAFPASASGPGVFTRVGTSELARWYAAAIRLGYAIISSGEDGGKETCIGTADGGQDYVAVGPHDRNTAEGIIVEPLGRKSRVTHIWQTGAAGVFLALRQALESIAACRAVRIWP